MADKYIYLEILKAWGGFVIGDVVRFGYSKGAWAIAQGIGKKVRKQKAVNDPQLEPKKEPPKVETATQPIPAETAVVTPVEIDKPSPPEENVQDDNDDK